MDNVEVIFDKEAFLDIVHFKRKGLCLSRAKLSKLSGVSVHQISQIENGYIDDIHLTFMSYGKLCAFLGISLDRYFQKKIISNNTVFKVKPKIDSFTSA